MATVVSSPWNYARTCKVSRAPSPSLASTVVVARVAHVCHELLLGVLRRTVQYATSPSESAHSSLHHIVALFRTARMEPQPMWFLQRRLQLGWGTARVGVGMALGHELYDTLRDHLDPQR
jgi:hypothetical protein